MSADPLGPSLSLIALFLLGFFVRATEAALPFADEGELEKSASQGSSQAKRALKMLAMSENRFGPLSIAHAFLMLCAATTAENWLRLPLSMWLADLLPALPSLPLVIISTAILLLFTALLFFIISGLVPGYIAAHAPERTLNATSGLTRLILLVLTPFTALIGLVSKLLVTPLGVKAEYNEEVVTEDEILAMVDIGEESGAIESDEKQMIENIFEFNNMDAEDCMVHRKDIIAIDIEDTREEILTTIRESGLSRFPVYEDDIDNIIGILITRDYLLNECSGGEKTLRELLRPAHFVPESVHSDVLFREMQMRKQHIAIVVDEYGGTSGLITLEDLLEEIVGNMYDEFDPKEEQDVTLMPDGRFRISGSLDLETLAEVLKHELPEQDEFDTLAGLVYSQLTEIPADGEQPVVTCFGLRIQVEKIADRRVEWAIVEVLPEEEKTEE